MIPVRWVVRRTRAERNKDREVLAKKKNEDTRRRRAKTRLIPLQLAQAFECLAIPHFDLRVPG